jgi:hypothetical protein
MTDGEKDKAAEAYKRMQKQQRELEKKSAWLGIATSVAGALVAALTGVAFFREFPPGNFLSSRRISTTELEQLSSQVRGLDKQVEALTVQPPPTAGLENVALQRVEARLAAAEEKLALVDKAIIDNPERAMSLPLLRRDMESLRSDIQLARLEMERVFDLMKWFVGGLAAAVLGAIGWLFTSREKKPTL